LLKVESKQFRVRHRFAGVERTLQLMDGIVGWGDKQTLELASSWPESSAQAIVRGTPTAWRLADYFARPALGRLQNLALENGAAEQAKQDDKFKAEGPEDNRQTPPKKQQRVHTSPRGDWAPRAPGPMMSLRSSASASIVLLASPATVSKSLSRGLPSELEDALCKDLGELTSPDAVVGSGGRR
jgi:hypothetical protein